MIPSVERYHVLRRKLIASLRLAVERDVDGICREGIFASLLLETFHATHAHFCFREATSRQTLVRGFDTS